MRAFHYLAMIMRKILFVVLIFGFLGMTVWGIAKLPERPTEKVNGLSFVAPRDSFSSEVIEPIIKTNANYGAVIPYAFMRSLDSDSLFYNRPRQWWGERPVGARHNLKLFKNHSVKTMLKPQIWIGRGAYTGDINFSTENQWQAFEKAYSEYILNFAKIASEEQAELFCIGTELGNFVDVRPEYWKQLIIEIRKIYGGKLTYAANWDEYKRVPFWEQLDYIGIDAYFPLSAERHPDKKTLKNAWTTIKSDLNSLSNKHKKPILFTEYGYISADYAAREPWKNAHDSIAVNLTLQADLYEVLYESLWSEDWFAGGFFWKWHSQTGRRSLIKRFTPQEKPALEVITRHYNFHNGQ